MRLICPNCDAQYEIADNAIPSDGREVQCSNCGHTWFQEHPYHSSENATTDDNRIDSLQNDDILFDDEELTLRQQPARRELHPSVSNILREEAELEKKARVKIPEDQSAPDPKSEKIEGKNIIDDGIMPNTEQLPKSPKKQLSTQTRIPPFPHRQIPSVARLRIGRCPDRIVRVDKLELRSELSRRDEWETREKVSFFQSGQSAPRRFAPNRIGRAMRDLCDPV